MAKKTTQEVISENVETLFSVTKKGKAQWCKYLEPDQYGTYAVDLYLDEEDEENFVEVLEGMRDAAYEALKKDNPNIVIKDVADVYKIKDGKKCFTFKSKPEQLKKTNGKITIIDIKGQEDKEFNKLVGNGSTIKVGFMAKPYYMQSTKSVGVALRFTAMQVIKLNEFSKSASGFADETDPDDTFSKEYKPKPANAVFLDESSDDDLGDVF